MTPDGVARRDIPGNRWDLLVPPRDHQWVPTRTVSICVPVRNPDERFRRMLSALALQTYPLDLIELVVVDDSSDVAVCIDPADLPFSSRVFRQEATGFAAGRARDFAASHASGDVLFFLDSDVIPGRRVVDSYLRWFERCADVVPFGFCRFVELSGLSDDAILDSVASERDLMTGREQVDSQQWRERTFSKTRDLTVDSPDMFRMIVGATLAVSSELYQLAGGFRDIGVRGIEDIEFGYRLQNHGALFVPDRDAVHWHQGRRTMSGERVTELEMARRPYAERLLPVGGFRGGALTPGPVEVVPQIELIVPDENGADPWIERLGSRLDSNTSVRRRSESGNPSAFAFVELDEQVDWTNDVTSGVMREFVRTGAGTVVLSKADRSEAIEVIRRRTDAAAGRGAARSRRREMFGVSVISWSEVASPPPLLASDALRQLLRSFRSVRRKISRPGEVRVPKP